MLAELLCGCSWLGAGLGNRGITPRVSLLAPPAPVPKSYDGSKPMYIDLSLCMEGRPDVDSPRPC